VEVKPHAFLISALKAIKVELQHPASEILASVPDFFRTRQIEYSVLNA
jgi:hypothetical protein